MDTTLIRLFYGQIGRPFGCSVFAPLGGHYENADRAGATLENRAARQVCLTVRSTFGMSLARSISILCVLMRSYQESSTLFGVGSAARVAVTAFGRLIVESLRLCDFGRFTLGRRSDIKYDP